MATENGANGVPIDDQIEPTVIGNLSERHFIFLVRGNGCSICSLSNLSLDEAKKWE